MRDAGVEPPRDAALPDGGPTGPEAGPLDAGSDAAVELIDNGSFEITSGDGGPVGITWPTRIDPWGVCAGEVVAGPEADQGSALDGEGNPTDGASFVSLSFGLTGPGTLSVQLNAPLEAGREYALAVDVARARNAPTLSSLSISGSTFACAAGAELLSAEPLDTSFQTFCMPFTPSTTFSGLVVQAQPSSFGVRVFVDNLRFVDACP